MTPFFSSPERIAALEAAAKAWLGTPYVQSGAVRGSGASCHRLVGAVLTDAGFPLAAVPERGATRLREYSEAMIAWLDGHPEQFAPVALDALKPGDVLRGELRIGHLALYIGDPGARVLQVLRNQPTGFVSFNDPQIRKFVLAAYRPLEISPS